MLTPVQRGYSLLNRLAQPMAAESVRYLRGTTEISSAMPAIFKSPQIELIDEGGASIIGRKFIWELKRDQLLWEGVEDRPRINDVIEWTRGNKTHTFTVQPEVGATPEAGAVDMRSDWVPAFVKLTGTTVE